MSLVQIRKLVVSVETVLHDGGAVIDPTLLVGTAARRPAAREDPPALPAVPSLDTSRAEERPEPHGRQPHIPVRVTHAGHDHLDVPVAGKERVHESHQCLAARETVRPLKIGAT